MKQVKAIFFALLITGAIGAALFMVGSNALANTNTVPVLNSPSSSTSASDPAAAAAEVVNASAITSNGTAAAQAAVQYANQANQLAQQLNQETTKLNQETQQLNTANAQLQAYSQQLQQYQQVLIALQQNGLIQVGSDGTIYMRRAGRGDNNNNFGTGNSVNNNTTIGN